MLYLILFNALGTLFLIWRTWPKARKPEPRVALYATGKSGLGLKPAGPMVNGVMVVARGSELHFPTNDQPGFTGELSPRRRDATPEEWASWERACEQTAELIQARLAKS